MSLVAGKQNKEEVAHMSTAIISAVTHLGLIPLQYNALMQIW